MKKNTRIYCSQKLIISSQILLEKKQSHYIKNVIRLDEGNFLSLFNENDGEFNCQIVKITKDNIEIKILDKTKNITNNYKLSLAFCPPKKVKLDVLMQKATELGIKSFHPLISNRTINRDLNIQRLKKIIIETIEQSDQVKIPQIENPVKFNSFIDKISCDDNSLLFVGDINCSDELVFKDHFDSSKNLFILIGPEGDFDEDEMKAINNCKNAIKFSLGKSILRSETAAISAISIFNYLTRQI